jgi:hypothetical protein
MSTPGAYVRLVRIGWVLVREGVISALPSENLPPLIGVAQSFAGLFARRRAKHEVRSDRLARAIERLGPSYVKIGQFLATRPDVVGADFAEDLSFLQDRMATFPVEEARAAVEGSLGRPVAELYAHFGDPIAAASGIFSCSSYSPSLPAAAVSHRPQFRRLLRPACRPRRIRAVGSCTSATAISGSGRTGRSAS